MGRAPRRNIRMRTQFFLLVTIIAFLAKGCVSKHMVGTTSDDFVFSAFIKSPTFQDLQMKVKRPTYMIERENDEFFILAVGENMPQRFSRIATLKISKKDGTVWKQSLGSLGEEVWELEIPAEGKVIEKLITDFTLP